MEPAAGSRRREGVRHHEVAARPRACSCRSRGPRAGPILRVFPRYAPVTDHLPGRLDTGDPIYFHATSERAASLNTAAIRRAGELVPDDAIFYVRAPSSDPRSDDVMLAAQLFLLPAIRTRRPDAAAWIVAYRAPVSAEPSGRILNLVLMLVGYSASQRGMRGGGVCGSSEQSPRRS
jgi:hypothetical protein